MSDILIFFASPHRDGNTAKLLGAFTDGVRRADKVDGQETGISIVDAYELAARPCLGCGACDRKDICSQSDLDDVDTLLRGADTVVIASPMYNYSFPSPMKAILDRWQRYYGVNARGEKVFEPGRRGVLLMSCGSPGRIAFEVVKKQMKNSFDMISCEFVEAILAPDTDKHAPDSSVLFAAGMAGLRAAGAPGNKG